MSKMKLNYRSGYTGKGPLQKFVPTAPAEKQINEETREITFVISTTARDRDGDVIMQDGWDLENYMKNPIVLWSHDPSQPPVARTKRISLVGNKLMATAQFPDKDTYDFGNTVFQMYKGGFLNATSVGFRPTELELMEGPEPGDFGFRFLKQELMEFSAVPIPSNPEALIVARGQGIDVAPMKRWIEQILDEHGAGTMEDILQRSFVALNGKLHPSMQDAIAQRNRDVLLRVPADTQRAEGDEPEVDDEAEAEDVPAAVVATGPADNPDAGDPHTHELQVGEAQTEPSEEDGHVHAVDYAEDGAADVLDADGHGHEVSATAPVITEDDEADEQDANATPQTEEDLEVFTPTNDPTHPNHGQPAGQRSLKENTATVKGLLFAANSEYLDVFPVAEAKALREDWPELWEAGGHADRFAKILLGDNNALVAREKWVARSIDGWDLAAVLSQIHNLAIGSRGLKHMRETLSKAKQDLVEQKASQPPTALPIEQPRDTTPEVDQNALIERIVERAIVPAIEAAIRTQNGRVS